MATATKTTAEDIATILAAASLGTVGTDLFIDFMPVSKPITVTAVVYNTGGFDPLATKTGVNDKPTFQIVVVGAIDDPVTTQQRCQAIKELLHLIDPFVTAGGTRYTGIWQVGGLNPLGDDENRRPMYSLNFRAHRTYA